MDDNKIELLEVLFKYLKVALGVIITFYPFNYGFLFDEIITILGVLIILTSGIRVAFHHDLRSVVRPG